MSVPGSVSAFIGKLTESQIEGLAKAALILGIGLGIALIVLGATLIPAPFGSAASTIGVTMLGAGVFAAVLKYFQFIGVFKQEFEGLLLSPNFRSLLLETHFSLANKGTDVYEHVTARKIAEFYPDLQDAFSRSKSDYSDGQFDYYFENFERKIVLRSFDQATGTIELEDETTVDIVPPNKEPVSYSFFVMPDARTLPDGFKMLDLTIDETNKTAEAVLTNGKIVVKQTLEGKRRYKVTRRAAQRYLLAHDPIKLHNFDRLTKEPKVRIRNEISTKVSVEFVPVNSRRDWTKKDVPTGLSSASEWLYSFPDLLFPHQGYYVTFSTIKPQAADAAKQKQA